MAGRLVAITGLAAAGKSTLARALQSELASGGELWLATELDVFGRGVPRDWVAMGEHRGHYAERGFVYSRGNDGTLTLQLGPDGRRVLTAFHRSVAAVVASGMSVICETIVYDALDWSDWREALSGVSTYWVRLAAPIEVLETRESADRTRVFQGLARGMSLRPSVGHYHIEADTSGEGTASIVRRVVEVLNSA